MFHFLFCISTLFIPDVCKPCTGNEVIIEHITTSFAGIASCGGYEAIKEAVSKEVEKLDYCSKYDPDVSDMPSGTWTYCGMVCFRAVKNLNLKKLPESWMCNPDEKFKMDDILMDCQNVADKLTYAYMVNELGKEKTDAIWE
jgi:hypothetical protein